MKYLTRERWQQTHDKWVKFIECVLNNEDICYPIIFWDSCGFCYAIIKQARIYRLTPEICDLCGCVLKQCGACSAYFTNDNSVVKAIRAANSRKFDDALDYGLEVLFAIQWAESEIEEENAYDA